MWTEPSIANVSLYDDSIRSSAAGSASTSGTTTATTKMTGPLHTQATNEPVNPYHVLQVRRDATPSEIRQSYRRLALFHHCGRAKLTSPTERQRRWQIFVIVAACYETLMEKESRSRLDLLLKERETGKLTAGLPTGEMYVGGVQVFQRFNHSGRINSLTGRDIPTNTTKSSSKTSGSLFNWNGEDDDDDAMPHDNSNNEATPPALASVSSESFSDSDDDDSHTDAESGSCDGGRGSGSYHSRGHSAHKRMSPASTSETAPSSPLSCFDCGGDLKPTADNITSLVIPSSSSSKSDGPEEHFTERDTNRIFGGPLAMLMEARRWQFFTDPFEVFEDVFGSKIFPVPSREELPALDWVPIRKSSVTGWQGSSSKAQDGTAVFVTSRILHDRRLVKTETIYKDAMGNRRSHISVTSEQLNVPTTANESTGCNPCLMCPSAPEPSDSDQLALESIHESSVQKQQRQGEGDSLLCGNLAYLYDQIHGECSLSFDDHHDFSWNNLWNIQLFPE